MQKITILSLAAAAFFCAAPAATDIAMAGGLPVGTPTAGGGGGQCFIHRTTGNTTCRMVVRPGRRNSWLGSCTMIQITSVGRNGRYSRTVYFTGC